MTRLSREQKRERKRAGRAQPAPSPIDVRVSAEGGATVGGMPVPPSAGESLQTAALDCLHRLALATGHPVLATVHDERIGYVVPLQIHVDGSSHYAGEPVRVGAAKGSVTVPGGKGGRGATAMGAASPVSEGAAAAGQGAAPAPAPAPVPVPPSEPPSESGDRAAARWRAPEPTEPPAAAPQTPHRDKSTHVLRAMPEPTPPQSELPCAHGQSDAQYGPPPQPQPRPDIRPQPRVQAEPDSGWPAWAESERGARPERQAQARPGVQAPPTGEFGPAPDPDLPPPPARTTPQTWHPDQATTPPQPSANAPRSAPISLEPQPWPPSQDPAHTSDAVAAPEPKHVSLNPRSWPPAPAHEPASEPTPEPSPAPAPAPAPATLSPPEESATDAYSAPEWKVTEEDSEPKPAPVREFDAVAESVLDTAEENGGTASPFAEPVSRINEAVKLGQIQEAAEMAEQTIAQATAALGPQHPEVLRLRELDAYIAYLSDDALRSFHLSLDLASLRHRLRDQRAAYGNIQSAAAAWRAVRDPLQGLHLGRDLIAVWTELAADAGPAADDLEQLEKARTRMGRLAERARALDAAPFSHGQ